MKSETAWCKGTTEACTENLQSIRSLFEAVTIQVILMIQREFSRHLLHKENVNSICFVRMGVKLAHKQACKNTLENTAQINDCDNSRFSK